MVEADGIWPGAGMVAGGRQLRRGWQLVSAGAPAAGMAAGSSTSGGTGAAKDGVGAVVGAAVPAQPARARARTATAAAAARRRGLIGTPQSVAVDRSPRRQAAGR